VPLTEVGRKPPSRTSHTEANEARREPKVSEKAPQRVRITARKQLARFPAKLLRAIARCGNDEAAVERVGIHYATEQCANLLDHDVDGIHFYTLNKSKATREIYSSLGLSVSPSSAKSA
jgi:hypothetical protein